MTNHLEQFTAMLDSIKHPYTRFVRQEERGSYTDIISVIGETAVIFTFREDGSLCVFMLDYAWRHIVPVTKQQKFVKAYQMYQEGSTHVAVVAETGLSMAEAYEVSDRQWAHVGPYEGYVPDGGEPITEL